MEDQEDGDFQDTLHKKEETLKEILSPIETYIMSLQSILVWENPYKSGVLFIGVHVLFWLAMTTRFYHLVGILGMAVMFWDIWFDHIWPQIKEPPSTEEESEEWTPVHPNLLNITEICQHGALIWERLGQYLDAAKDLRKTNHRKFFFYSLLVLSSIAAIGCYVDGLYLAYFTVLGILLLPCVLYHRVGEKFSQRLYPVLRDVEEKINIKRRSSKKGRKAAHPKNLDENIAVADSDSDEDLAQFIPNLPKKGSPQPVEIEERLTDTRDTPDSLETSQQIPTNDSSSDVHAEDTESQVEDTSLFFASGMQMPSVNASSDFSWAEGLTLNEPSNIVTEDHENIVTEEHENIVTEDHENIVTEEHENIVTEEHEEPEKCESEIAGTDIEKENNQNGEKPESKKSEASMHFVSSHFREPSLDDPTEDSLASGLSFPDIDEQLDLDAKEDTQGDLMAGDPGQTLASAISTQLVQHTVSTIMASTLSSLNRLGESVNDMATARGDSTDSLEPSALDVTEPETGHEREDSPMDEGDAIEAEFEFLNEEDFSEIDASLREGSSQADV